MLFVVLCVFPIAQHQHQHHIDAFHTKQGRLDQTRLPRTVACYSVMSLCGVGWQRRSVIGLRALSLRNFRTVDVCRCSW
jgi:hypothetical protein